jgi:RND family efflux transporter MFP subunit
MELVAAAAGTGQGDELSIELDAVARRVAGIRTVAVHAEPIVREINVIGEICYDESELATISAYVDGRLDRLYADYTGVVVTKGDHLALLYSPELYAGQVEVIQSKRALREHQASTLTRVVESQQRLYEGARRKLLELGITKEQLQDIESQDKANSRMHLCAPISGTVIEKFAVEGQYVKTGQPIYRMADLSTVWLMLELFPEDAALIRYGQRVTATVQSLPGRSFAGRVAFKDPMVNPRTRTVGVRVVIENPHGSLLIGDYAKANIEVELAANGEQQTCLYDPDLAGKWISPRHPHVVESSPGQCRECGVALVPADRFGFAPTRTEPERFCVVPRDAVLMAGANSVVYVETEPGRFEIRPVVLGPITSNQIVILEGLKEDEQVAVAGNFLIDSQMQLAGNPSLIDPTRAKAQGPADTDSVKSAELIAALSSLNETDRLLAEAQKICPVTKMPLGSMGTPPKIDVQGRLVFICCQGCEQRLLDEPQKHLANLPLADSELQGDSQQGLAQMELPQMELPQMAVPQLGLPSMETPSAENGESQEIAAALTQLSPTDRTLASRQKMCPVADMPLGSMGTPIKVMVRGNPVFICCEGCRESLLANPAEYLAKLSKEAVR